MNLTSHVITRCRQRGIPEHLLEIIRDRGVKEKRHGAIRSTFRKRDCDRLIHELKRFVQQLEKLKGISVVASEENGTIITAYRKNRRSL